MNSRIRMRKIKLNLHKLVLLSCLKITINEAKLR